MHEKKKRIIEEGIRLFANKGFHATSIQEIAELSGVSKGAFYLHFQSKDDLILSIYQFYYEVMKVKLKEVDSLQGLTARERLVKQVHVHFEEFLKHKEFIVMQLRETFSLNEEVDSFVNKMREEQQEWLEHSIRSIYDEGVNSVIKDAAAILEGLIAAYLKTIIFEQITYSFEELSKFIVRRLDDLVTGLIDEGVPGVLTARYNECQVTSERFNDDKKKEAKELFTAIQSTIYELNLTASKQEELVTAIQVMLEELEKDKPQKVVFQGMLTHFKGVEKLEGYRMNISQLFQLELL